MINFKIKTFCIFLAAAPADSCPGTTIDLTACGVTAPTSIYKMKFTSCSSLPKITLVSLQNVGFNDLITITGTSFSATECENQVLIGDIPCALKSSSTTQLTCQLGPNSGLIPGVVYQLNVLVKNIGFALKTENFPINFIPTVTSFSPTVGSTAGGTVVTINGDGFNQDTTVVAIGQTSYYKGKNAQITNNTIVITTSNYIDDTNDLQVYVNNVLAVCTSDQCQYSFSDQSTPTLSQISPLTVNDSTLMTLTGASFGSDPTKIKITIGSSNCGSVSITSNTVVTCQLDGLNLGKQNVNLNVDGKNNNIFIDL